MTKKTIFKCSKCQKEYEKITNGNKSKCCNAEYIPIEIEEKEEKQEKKKMPEENKDMIRIRIEFLTKRSNARVYGKLMDIINKLKTKEIIETSSVDNISEERKAKEAHIEEMNQKEEKVEEEWD